MWCKVVQCRDEAILTDTGEEIVMHNKGTWCPGGLEKTSELKNMI
jgi:hypothetical protein